jgi:hypothetical protein
MFKNPATLFGITIKRSPFAVRIKTVSRPCIILNWSDIL